jgi:hypothetical protein
MAGNPPTLYRSTAQTLKPEGQPLKKWTLPPYSPQYEAAYQIVQALTALQTTLTIPALNTPASNAAFSTVAPANDANAILAELGAMSDNGNGVIKFNATFARVPASWDDFKTMPFQFPGFPGIIGQNNTRNEFSQKVTVRLHYDYFVVDPTGLTTGVLDSAGNAINTVTAEGNIPSITKKYFLVCTAEGVSTGANGIRTNSIVPVGGKLIGTTQWFQTLPQLATYLQWILNAAPYLSATPPAAWSNTNPPIWNGTSDNGNAATEGQIVMDDSTLQPYIGNIIARVTPYVLIR